MKVLMFGWEFPPYKSGGLGTACYDLCKGLNRQGVEVTFVMPVAPEDANAEFVKLVGANNVSKVKIKPVKTLLKAYQTEEMYAAEYHKLDGASSKGVYGANMYQEIERLKLVAQVIAEQEPHDIIHAHDWMTYDAGLAARDVSGKPLVVHIHATEFDRTAGNPNQHIAAIEHNGMSKADMVIANSNWTKQNVMNAYQLPSEKIKVVHWGIEEDNEHYHINYESPLKQKDKIVLFLGRVTVQKGPDYFIEAARKVLDFVPNTKFMFAGSGDMLPRCINRVAELGMSERVIFTGFLKGADVHKAFQTADVYVMPSVSEPFGLVALEALKNKAPLIISNQSGASEVLSHCLKTDFWDVDRLTSQIVSVLKYPELYRTLRDNGHQESHTFNLDEPARKTKDIYHEVLANN